MRSPTLRVFSKFCIDCVWPEQWEKIQRWAAGYNFKLDVFRTTYHPKRHEAATMIWGADNYRAFLVSPKGYPIALNELAKCLTEEGEWKDDLPGLRRTKEAFGQTSEVVADKKTHQKTSQRRKRSRRREVGDVD